MNDRVTISLYSVETDDVFEDRQDFFLSQLSNIKKIRDGLVAAAESSKDQRSPPEFIVSILLVPKWDRPNNSYTDDEYIKKKSAFLAKAKSIFESINGVLVEDFYSDCVMLPEHRKYMHGLKALGSNADMIKTIAIINNTDRCRHLQIDSNTVVPSFEELYRQTFVAPEQKDGINASYYDNGYISAHNKMVYTVPGGAIATRSHLQLRLWEWCKDHQDDNNVDQDKQPSKNSIYARVFTEALHEVEYVAKFSAKGKLLYPATLSPKVYWLTDYMVTAINMSWSSDHELRISNRLKELPAISIGKDGAFNFPCFLNVIKKYTGDLSLHSLMLGIEDTSLTGEESRKLLLSLSKYNNEMELQALKQFYNHATQENSKLAHELSSFFPDTLRGNSLTQQLFGCSVAELQEQAKKVSNSATDEIPIRLSK